MTRQYRDRDRVSRIAPRSIAIALFVALSLSGCENFPSDPMAMKLAGEDVVLVVCESLTADGLYMEMKNTGKWSVFWQSEGSVSLGPEQELTLVESQADALGATIFVRPTTEPGATIFIGVDNDDSPLSGDFTIPKEGLQQSEWLHTDGSTSKWPCAYQEWRNPD